MPCPNCGFQEHGKVTYGKGWHHAGRRVLGVAGDHWLVGPGMRCKTCAVRKQHLKDQGELKLAAECKCTYQSYDKESLRLYVAPALLLPLSPPSPSYHSRYPEMIANLGIVITSAKTAFTSDLADLTMELLTSGVAAARLATILTTLKEERLTSAQIIALGTYRTKIGTGGQQTLSFAGPPEPPPEKPTRETHGLCAPSGRLIRHYFDDAQEAESAYQFKRRMDLVWATFVAIDDSLKVNKSMKIAGHVCRYVFSPPVPPSSLTSAPAGTAAPFGPTTSTAR